MWCEGGSDREAVVARFGEIGDWNVSAVTGMQELFAFQDFNEDISRWDTSNVTTMLMMFNQASSFNQPVEGWNTANVTNMDGMFENASSFTQRPSWLPLEEDIVLRNSGLRQDDSY